MNIIQQLAAPVGRLLLVLLFITSGFGKIMNYPETVSYMEGMGVPGLLLPLVVFTEIVGSALILVGYRTRLVAFLLAGYSILTALVFHVNFSDHMQFINFMKNVSIAGGFLMMVAFGAGCYSIDNRNKS